MFILPNVLEFPEGSSTSVSTSGCDIRFIPHTFVCIQPNCCTRNLKHLLSLPFQKQQLYMNNLLSPIIVKFDSVVTKVIVQFKVMC